MSALTFVLPVTAVQVYASGGATDAGDPQWNLVITDTGGDTLTLQTLTSSKDDLLTFARQIEDAVR